MFQTRNSDQPAQTASLIRISIFRKTIFLSIKNNQDRNSTAEQHRRWSDWTEALWNFDFSMWQRNVSDVYMCNLAVNHADIPHYTAHLNRLIYTNKAHMSLRKIFSRGRQKMQWPPAKFVQKLTERTVKMFANRIWNIYSFYFWPR